MDNRRYNIYFHTHTISGIIICALLYVVFFAGSLAFFKDDLAAWQKNNSYVAHRQALRKDYNLVLDSLSKHKTLTGRDIDFRIQRNGEGAYVNVSASHDSIINKKATPKVEAKPRRRGRPVTDDSEYFTYNFFNGKTSDYYTDYDIGEFLYRLHFLAQLNVVPIHLGFPFGYLVAGIVAFLFLFALITGLMLHWDKMVSNFFTFRPWSKWKTVWTDIHTALGVIQFPFQFIFAVTGVVLIANSFLMAPYTSLLYKGDSEKLYQELEYNDSSKFEYSYKPLAKPVDVSSFVANLSKRWPSADIHTVLIKNYMDENMHIIVQAKALSSDNFSGSGKLIYRVRDQRILHEDVPAEHASYVDKIKGLIYHLHFGDFGGRPLKIVYFILGMMGCVVIISGILIWLVARDKKSVPASKRAFNFWTANVFLAVSLSMLPVTAFTMLALLFLENPGQSEIFHWYFYSWLVLSVYFIVRRNLARTNREVLMLSTISCFCVPLFDGAMRGNWLWSTFSKGQFDILLVDVLFLALSGISLVVLYRMAAKKDYWGNKKSSGEKNMQTEVM